MGPARSHLRSTQSEATRVPDGGYLQVGSPNDDDPSALITELGLDLVFVFPAYRMNAFGFLASTELATAADPNGGGGGTIGNLGFWDQRLALEWVQAHVAGFGGNPREITVAGLSAGAYSTFHQLAYEVGLPDDAACIRRVVMWSNGCGLPPKPVAEVQTAVDKLLAELLISADLDPQTKLEKLRAEPWEEIVCAVAALPENSFRAVTDGAFVRASLFEELRLGTFAETLRRRGVKIVTGEVRDEINEYREVSPPSSHDGLVTRLAIEYPEVIAKEMGKTYCPNGTLPPDYETWQDLFGKVYSDMQVYVSERGFLSMIAPSLPLSSISRYRIEWRAKCVDDSMPPEKGVSHGSDLEIWFFGDGAVLLPKEKELVRNFLDPWKQFLNGQGFDWGTKSIEDFRMIAEDGHNVSIEKDKRWGECIQIWKSILQMDDTSQ